MAARLLIVDDDRKTGAGMRVLEDVLIYVVGVHKPFISMRR